MATASGTTTTTATATVTRWSRAFVVVGVGFFVATQAAAVADLPRSAIVALGVNGFVFHVVFGKAYGLLPSYFARELAVPFAPAIHLPFAAVGAIGRAASAAGVGPAAIGQGAAVAWFVGCLVFAGSLLVTIRDNPLGRETGTGAVDRHRERVDRAANAAVPVVLVYLLVGSSLPVVAAVGSGAGLEPSSGIPPAGGPPVTHLLAAGTAALLVFAVGFRLLPRFLVADPPPALVAVVLPAGALAPALLAADFRGGSLFRLGAALQAIAVVGFAVAYFALYAASERRRVGIRTVLVAVSFGVAAVALGLSFAFLGVRPGLLEAHVRFAVVGFLGLTIVGVTFQFYPPAIASAPGIGDRSAGASVAALAVGVGLEASGLAADSSALVTVGTGIGLVGALLYAATVGAVFYERHG